ncbi:MULTISPECIES: acyl carrier protein [unclassified Thiocapsa]|uniref:acyl carrier protein n=1 Tax=unclassified Thiocapsa TaxID=2641286 RepID=UPI0035B12115
MIDQSQLLALLQKSGSDVEPALEDFDKAFNEIGLDSLDVYNFLSEIEVELGKKVSDEDFQRFNSLNDVLAFLNG